MATPNEKPGTQLDIEATHVDRAIRAVRDFQKGAATAAFTRAALKAVAQDDLSIVQMGTRVPLNQLERLRAGH
ncbi:MAG: hypothetical protein [Arizlama microvirus]|nr:MAG: hypothetical protein [Arizlama microvirus]